MLRMIGKVVLDSAVHAIYCIGFKLVNHAHVATVYLA